jgi:O-antigen/teichoic acid export membrane protein
MVIFVPIVVVLTVGAYPLLRFLFGEEYAENGEVVMRLMAPGLLPFAILILGVAVARVRRQVARLLFLSFVYAGISLPLSIVFVESFGIDGAAAAWLIAQVGAAAIAVAVWSLRLFEGPSKPAV